MHKNWVLWLVNILALLFLSFSVHSLVAADINTTLSVMVPVGVITVAITAAVTRK